MLRTTPQIFVVTLSLAADIAVLSDEQNSKRPYNRGFQEPMRIPLPENGGEPACAQELRQSCHLQKDANATPVIILAAWLPPYLLCQDFDNR